MIEFLTTLIIGIICIILGAFNMKGNISTLHWYHRYRVKKEDIKSFGKKIGLGTIIIGCSIVLSSILSSITFLLVKPIFEFVGYILLTIGFVVGLAISLYAMIKYNNGIF